MTSTPKHEATDAMGLEPVDHETEAFKVLQVIEQRAWALGDEQYARLAKEAKDHLSRATTQPAEQSASSPVEGEEVERTLSGETVCGFPVQAWRFYNHGADPKFGHNYCEHWSTPGAGAWGVERMFTEAQIREALTTRSVVVSSESVRDAVLDACRQYHSAKMGGIATPSQVEYVLKGAEDAILNPARKPEGGAHEAGEVERLRRALEKIASGQAGCDDFQDAQAIADDALKAQGAQQ